MLHSVAEGERRRLNAALLLVILVVLVTLSVLVWGMPSARVAGTPEVLQADGRFDEVVKPVELSPEAKARETPGRVEIAAPVTPKVPSLEAASFSRLPVRVVDKSRHAIVGATLRLMCGSREQILSRSRPTDERGESFLRISMEDLKRQGIEPEEAKAYVELVYFGSENPRRSIDLVRLPKAPLEFKVASFGRIDFVLPVVSLGFLPKARLFVGPLGPDGSPSPERSAGGSVPTPSASEAVASAVPVALGKEWRVDGMGGGDVPLKRMPFSGPRAPGETVRIDLEVYGKPSWLVGTLVNEEQERLAEFSFNTSFEYHRKDIGLSHRAASCRTNEKGEFLLRIPKLPREPGTPVQLIARTAVPSSRSGDKRVYGSWKRMLEQEHEAPGSHSLGTVTLSVLEAILSGEILDDRGQPVPARLLVKPVLATTADKIGYGRTLPLSHMKDVDGGFSIYGETTEGRLALFVRPHSSEYVDLDPLVVNPGRQGIRIVLQRWGSLTLRLRAPSKLMARSFFRVDLRKEGDPARRLSGPARGRDDLLKFDLLAPGRYSLKVYGASDPEPCAMISDLLVKPGSICEDPRLHPLDLASSWREALVRLTLPDGEPATCGFVVLQYADGGVSSEGWAIEDGVARILTMRPEIDLIVRVPGMLEGRLGNVRGSGELQLLPGMERSIENPGSILSGHELVFAFRALEGEAKADDRIRIRHGATGLLSMSPRVPAPGAGEELVLGSKQERLSPRFTRPGRYRVYCQLRRKRDGACVTVQGAVQDIEITPKGGQESLHLGLTKARIQAALQALPPER